MNKKKHTKKLRIDQLLVKKSFFPTLKEAQANILTGNVITDDRCLDKCGELVYEDIPIHIKKKPTDFVGRGGIKLEKAIETFGIDVRNKVCMDVGAHVGGFTDVLLSRGAKRVFAVDVGYGLLAWKLQQDQRVINLQRTDARKLNKALVPDPIDMLVADVSFNSLERILPPLLPLLGKQSAALLLIKPHFEAEKVEVQPGGIVDDPIIHERICNQMKDFMESLNFQVPGIIESPIRGQKGNKEFFIYAILKIDL